MEPFIGQDIMYEVDVAPRSWAFCEDIFSPSSFYSALFPNFDSTIVGEGRTTSAIACLRSKSPMELGSGLGLSVGVQVAKSGSVINALIVGSLPSHVHSLSSIPLKAGGQDVSKQVSLVPGVITLKSPSVSGRASEAENNLDPDETLNLWQGSVLNSGYTRGKIPVDNFHPCKAMTDVFPSRDQESKKIACLPCSIVSNC